MCNPIIFAPPSFGTARTSCSHHDQLHRLTRETASKSMEVKLLQRPLSILILDSLYRKKSQCSRHCLMSQMSQVKPELVFASQDTASGSQNANREFLNIVLKQQVCFHPSTHNHFVSSAVLAERCFHPFQDKTPYSDIEGDKNVSQFNGDQSILSVSLADHDCLRSSTKCRHSCDTILV